MRTGGPLSYILADHLGSTSIVTDSAGTVVSDTKYKAWGDVRYASGANPIGYTYTGQYSHTADFGLMFYNARWYDPSLGRFASADSIVPAGVQGYDRYAYVSNNPLRYVDPSGHKACDETDANGNCVVDKLGRLLDYVYGRIVNDEGQVKKKFTALGAMNMIVKRAAYIYGNDWDSFFKATNYIFLGIYSNSPYTMAVAHSAQGFHGITFSSGAGDTGFNHDFVQGGDNQVRHFWAGFSTAANGHKGIVNAQYGNFYHDVVEDWIGHKDTTYSDFTLTITAVDIANDVNTSVIASPSDLPGVFDMTLGIDSPGYNGINWLWLFRTPDE